jgi:hypothetical protein
MSKILTKLVNRKKSMKRGKNVLSSIKFTVFYGVYCVLVVIY